MIKETCIYLHMMLSLQALTLSAIVCLCSVLACQVQLKPSLILVLYVSHSSSIQIQYNDIECFLAEPEPILNEKEQDVAVA